MCLHFVRQLHSKGKQQDASVISHTLLLLSSGSRFLLNHIQASSSSSIVLHIRLLRLLGVCMQCGARLCKHMKSAVTAVYARTDNGPAGPSCRWDWLFSPAFTTCSCMRAMQASTTCTTSNAYFTRCCRVQERLSLSSKHLVQRVLCGHHPPSPLVSSQHNGMHKFVPDLCQTIRQSSTFTTALKLAARFTSN